MTEKAGRREEGHVKIWRMTPSVPCLVMSKQNGKTFSAGDRIGYKRWLMERDIQHKTKVCRSLFSLTQALWTKGLITREVND